MNREKTLVKNTLILSLGTVLPKLVSFITLPILTAYLTTAEYGSYDLINTLVSLFLPVVTMQIQTAAFRYLIECRNNENEQRKIISNIMIFTYVVSAISLLVLFFVLNDLSFQTRIYVCIYFAVDILINTYRQIIRGLGKNKIYSVSSFIDSVTKMIFTFLFVKLISLGLNGVLISLILSIVLAYIYMLIKSNIGKYISIKELNKDVIIKMLKYSWPMVPNSLSGWVMRLSNRLVIVAFLGIEANAIYAVVTKIPTLYSVLQSTFTLAWQENASVVSKDKDASKYYSDMFDVMYGLFFTIMAMLIAATPIIFIILIQGDYDEAYFHMSILYIAYFFSSLSSYLGGVYVAHMKTKNVGITTVVAAAINVLVNLILIQFIGLFSAAIAMVVSYMILVIYRMIDVQKFQKISFKIPKCILLFLCLCFMSFLNFQKIVYLDIINVFIAVIVSYIVNKNIINNILKSVIKKIKKRTL